MFTKQNTHNMFEKVDLNKFNLVSNYCLIKLSAAYDLIVLDGPEGKKIDIKIVSWGEQEVNHYSISGTIIKKPQKLFFFNAMEKNNGNYSKEEFASMMKNSLQYDVDFPIEEGDTIFFNYNAQLDADKELRLMDTEEYGICILIHYNSFYGYKKDNDIIPLNGYIFFKRDQNEREVTFKHGLIGIQEVKQYDNNHGTVIAADMPVRAYLDGGRDGNAKFERGTRILVDKRFGHRMAYDLHGGDLKDIEVTHRKYTLCILNEELQPVV